MLLGGTVKKHLQPPQDAPPSFPRDFLNSFPFLQSLRLCFSAQTTSISLEGQKQDCHLSELDAEIMELRSFFFGEVP